MENQLFFSALNCFSVSGTLVFWRSLGYMFLFPLNSWINTVCITDIWRSQYHYYRPSSHNLQLVIITSKVIITIITTKVVDTFSTINLSFTDRLFFCYQKTFFYYLLLLSALPFPLVELYSHKKFQPIFIFFMNCLKSFI